ncbi:MAG: L-aspartate oxidase, partial [Gemmatimonadaceae bacterium]
MADRIRTRFLVIGSGIAGLQTAWRCSDHGEVVVLTKRTLRDSATAWAQGGIAAALGAGDSPALHKTDTLAAGAALCDAAAVEVLVAEGPDRVRELASAGARFDMDAAGRFTLGHEAAHSRKRIVHAQGDQTGAEVARALIHRVSERANIRVLETARALDLIIVRGQCCGVRANVAGRAVEILADATVLATGGCGQLYKHTTNPLVATGDGYAIAWRAGATLADMEFVQFHPTALDTAENPLALVSEAVRGEGAILINDREVRFMPRRHALAELAPRDVVAREIFRQEEVGRRVFLDARALKRSFARRFPGILQLCLARGIDPRRAPLPGTPPP